MSFSKQYDDLQTSVQKLSYHKEEMEKNASVLGFLGVLAAGEAAMKGIAGIGKAKAGNFLNAGIELGQKGQKMNPYTENLSRNILGNKQLAPYDAGLKIGERMKNMPPEQSERFLNRIVGIGNARATRLAEETGKKVNDPILDALDKYQRGADRSSPMFNNLLTKGSKPIEANTLAHDVTANVLTLPGVMLDSRAAIRPIVRNAENHPKVKKITGKIAPENTKREKVYKTVRDYID